MPPCGRPISKPEMGGGGGLPPCGRPISKPEMGDEEDCPPVVIPFQNQKWGDEEDCHPTMDALQGIVRLGVSQFSRSMLRSTAAGRG